MDLEGEMFYIRFLDLFFELKPFFEDDGSEFVRY